VKVKTVTKELETLKKKRPSPDSFDDLDRALQEEMNNQVAKVRISNKIYHRSRSDPVFVNLFRSPGIDSQPGESYRHAGLHRLAEPIPRNRFLGSFNVCKYRLRVQIKDNKRL
jgi:hypothetical protein